MSTDCDRFEKMLSAYLDGRLSPDEMAEVAAHLEACEACSALLDKMARLDELAAGAVSEFDDALMKKLADRIENGLDAVEKSAKETISHKPKVIPIWHRYAAVAASIVIVFFVGRMAFKDIGTDLMQKRPSYSPVYKRISPAADKKADRSDTVAGERRDVVEKGGGVKDGEGISSEVSGRPESPAHERQQMPKPIAPPAKLEDEMKSLAQPVEKLPEHAEPEPEMAGEVQLPQPAVQIAEEIVRPAPVRIRGKIIDRQTGEPLQNASVQLLGTTIGATSDEKGEYIIEGVPPDTYDLMISSSGYSTLEIADVAAADDSAEHNIELNKETSSLVTLTSTDKAAAIVSDERDTVALPVHATYSEPLTVDSLEELYARAVLPRGDKIVQFRVSSYEKGKSSPTILINKVETLLDSIDAVSPQDASYRRIEDLYLRARAHYDLYRETRENAYLERARAYKSKLKEIIEQRLESGDDTKILRDYRDEIDRWRF